MSNRNLTEGGAGRGGESSEGSFRKWGVFFLLSSADVLADSWRRIRGGNGLDLGVGNVILLTMLLFFFSFRMAFFSGPGLGKKT